MCVARVTGLITNATSSHLAALKLTAIAKALAAALEQAEQTKPGYTCFLSDLLAIEVQAAEQRALQSRLRLAGFPRPRHWRSSTSTPNPP